jgi:hypothetical protein
MAGFKKLPAVFYRSSAGREPVREWLKEMQAPDRKIVGDDIRDCEFAWPVGLPLCRPIAGRTGLWEIRSNLTDGRKTPFREIDLAVRRMKGGA